ncbi:50S ribosomal protein L25/general stress protein Ctc [Bacillus marinisedimentorum]|uniref:50S ribosomal protein L25/general stress protein Ctc n=1 Tax=Bacillus marinisedimentorum TaxID=1821260 RepID=UPI00087307A0|nr:50S ribosomal protein L25/general stress protein Ctc [Bacillus marinisedimentorum]
MAVTLHAKKRDNLNHSTTRKLRDEGNFPAVVYGYKTENQTIYINYADFIKTIREAGRNGILDLQVEGQNSRLSVMLQDYQTEPIKDEILHADFIAVNLKEEVEVEVPVHLTGEAAGVKEGGVVQHTLHNLNVRALPSDLPEYIELDVSALEIGDALQVQDLKKDGKYEILDEQESTIITVLPPQKPEEEEADEEAEAEEESGGQPAESKEDAQQEEVTEEDE